MTSRCVPLAVLTSLMSAAAPTLAEENAMPRSITVSGEGKVASAPNLASITLGVVSEGNSAGEALRANSEAMASLQKILKQEGIADRDIQTTNLSVQPRYSQPQGRGLPNQGEFVPRIVGYSVSNNVSIRVRDLTKLGELLDAVVGAGANQMFGIAFSVDEPGKVLDEARRAAMADARRKAEILAKEAGLGLGKPLRINEGGGYEPPRPMMRGEMMMAAAGSVPVASGEVELSASVQVVYELIVPE